MYRALALAAALCAPAPLLAAAPAMEVALSDELTLVAEARATEVVPESGRARVKGVVTFAPKRARARRH